MKSIGAGGCGHWGGSWDRGGVGGIDGCKVGVWGGVVVTMICGGSKAMGSFALSCAFHRLC